MAEILAAFGDDSMGRLVPTSTLPRPVAEATQNRTRLESRAERLLSMTIERSRNAEWISLLWRRSRANRISCNQPKRRGPAMIHRFSVAILLGSSATIWGPKWG